MAEKVFTTIPVPETHTGMIREEQSMNRGNRKELICRKQIKGNIYDKFRVIVKENNVDAAKKEYERQGYTVFKM